MAGAADLTAVRIHSRTPHRTRHSGRRPTGPGVDKAHTRQVRAESLPPMAVGTTPPDRAPSRGCPAHTGQRLGAARFVAAGKHTDTSADECSGDARIGALRGDQLHRSDPPVCHGLGPGVCADKHQPACRDESSPACNVQPVTASTQWSLIGFVPALGCAGP